MLTEIRKVTRGWVASLILGLIIFAFAIWGINDWLSPTRATDVASGRGIEVTPAAFNSEFDREIDQMRARTKAPLSRQDAVEQNLHMMVAERMVSEAVFDRLSRQVGIGSSDGMVKTAIQNDPSFRSEITGAFNEEAYREVLRLNRLTDTMYERELSARMKRAQLAGSLVAGVRAPSSFGRLIQAFESETREVAVVAIPANRVPAPPAPTAEQIETFYKANAAAFALPEFRAFTLIRADHAAFEARVDVPDAKVREVYEFQKARLQRPETRSFVVLSGPDAAKAQDAARRLAAGEDPQAIATALGMQSVAFENKTKADAPDQRLADAVFAAAKGQVVGPIQGVATSVARVTDITAARAPTFDDMRAAIRSELAREEADKLLQEAIDRFEEARSGGAPLEAAASQAGLIVARTPLVTQRGLGENAQPVPGAADQPAVLRAVFEAAEGEPTDWETTEDGGSFLVRVDTLRPSGPPPLDSVRDRAAAAWRVQQMGAAMEALAEQLSSAVTSGRDFATVARELRLQVVTPGQTVDRRSIAESPLRALAGGVFGAREGEVVSGPGQGGVLLAAQVTKINRADPQTDREGLERGRAFMDRALGEDVFATVQAAARQDARVRVNQTVIDGLVGKSASQDDEN